MGAGPGRRGEHGLRPREFRAATGKGTRGGNPACRARATAPGRRRAAAQASRCACFGAGHVCPGCIIECASRAATYCTGTYGVWLYAPPIATPMLRAEHDLAFRLLAYRKEPCMHLVIIRLGLNPFGPPITAA